MKKMETMFTSMTTSKQTQIIHYIRSVDHFHEKTEEDFGSLLMEPIDLFFIYLSSSQLTGIYHNVINHFLLQFMFLNNRCTLYLLCHERF